MSYELPSNLPREIDDLEALIGKFRSGELEAVALKARRVPFGCYEQRKDGAYMVRMRATGGDVTLAQLVQLAELAERYGSAFVHITTRQEFQIHDLALESIVPVMHALLQVGLSSRGGGGNTVRNIVVSPTAGIDVNEVFDPSPYAFALTTRLIAEPDSWNLPRKLKIAFSNSPADTAFAQFTDIGFIASLRNGERGFKVYVAGGFGAKSSVGHLLHELFRPVRFISSPRHSSGSSISTATARIATRRGCAFFGSSLARSDFLRSTGPSLTPSPRGPMRSFNPFLSTKRRRTLPLSPQLSETRPLSDGRIATCARNARRDSIPSLFR